MKKSLSLTIAMELFIIICMRILFVFGCRNSKIVNGSVLKSKKEVNFEREKTELSTTLGKDSNGMKNVSSLLHSSKIAP